MPRTRLTVACLALVATLALLCGSAAAAGDAPADFSAIAKVTSAKQKGSKTAVFKERLKSGGRKIGHSKLKLTFGSKKIRFVGKWRFRDGRIKARGKLRDKAKNSVRIVKATGAYKGGRGKVRLEQITERRNRETFDFK